MDLKWGVILVNFVHMISVMYWINYIVMLDTYHKCDEDKVQTFAVIKSISSFDMIRLFLI